MKIKCPFYLVYFFLAVLSQDVKSQGASEPGNVQSPNAAMVGLFSQYPTSNFTGVPTIGIPLYSVTDHNVSIPISLSYHASGVKVDTHPGWVGLNWGLAAGGVITRSVNGKQADDASDPNSYWNVKSGYYFQHNLLSVPNWNDVSYIKAIAETTYIPNGLPEDATLDTEPDEFDFSFGNYSGKFFLSDDGSWKVKCSQPVKVTFNNQFLQPPFVAADPGTADYGLSSYSPCFSGFTITTENGMAYVFGGTTDAIDFGIPFFDQGSQQGGQWIANSWYLTAIYSSNGTKIAGLVYEPDDYIDQLYTSYSTLTVHSADYKCLSQTESGTGTIWGPRMISGQLIRPVYLKSISTDDYDVLFNRSTSTELRYDNAYTGPDFYNQYPYPFLQANVGEISNQSHPTAMPACFDNLKWKELNQILIKQKNGSLIKGFNFTYNNDPYERLMLNAVTEFESDLVEKPPYKFYYNLPTGIFALPDYLAEVDDHWGYFNGNYSGGSYYSGYYAHRETDPNYLQAGTLKSIYYPTGGITEFTFEPNDYSRQLQINRYAGVDDLGLDKFAGGLRIRKISNIDPDMGQRIEKEYFYVRNYDKNYSPGNTAYLSSGVLGANVQYNFLNVPVTSTWGNPFFQDSFSIQPVLPGSYNAQGSHIGYSEVVEKLKDGSYTKYFFTNFDNGHLDEPAVNIFTTETPYNPISSTDEERGAISKVESHNSNGDLVKNVEYQYTALNKNNEFVKAIKARCYLAACNVDGERIDEGSAYKQYTYSYLPAQEKETLYDLNGLNPVTTIKNYYYDSPIHRQVTRIESSDSKGNLRTVVNRYPYEMVNLGQTVPFLAMINLNIMSPLVEQEHQLNGLKQNKDITQFALDPNSNFFLPTLIQSQRNNQTPETRKHFLKYDGTGNVISLSQEGAAKVNYIWSYHHRYAVAKITNADYADVENVLGGATVVEAFANSMPTNAAVNSFLSPLRSAPNLANAQVMSFTYAFPLGVTTATDAKGYTTSYEYDDFERLSTIRDQNNNIIKHVDYHIAAHPVGNPFFSAARSGRFYSVCDYGLRSSPVIYTVPPGSYTSTISQADADQQAQNDVNTNGQAFANAHHNCQIFYPR